MSTSNTAAAEELRKKLFEHLDRFRVSGMDQGAQLCVLCDASERFLQSSGAGAETIETNRMVREYLQEKQNAMASQRTNWHAIWGLKMKRIGRAALEKKQHQTTKSEQTMNTRKGAK